MYSLENLLIGCTLLSYGHAFWWDSETTEAPEVQPIPLAYFRTLTYQPIPWHLGQELFPMAPFPAMMNRRYDHNMAGPFGQIQSEKVKTPTSRTKATENGSLQPGFPRSSLAQVLSTFRKNYHSNLEQINNYRLSYPYPEYSFYNHLQSMGSGTPARCTCPEKNYANPEPTPAAAATSTQKPHVSSSSEKEILSNETRTATPFEQLSPDGPIDEEPVINRAN